MAKTKDELERDIAEYEELLTGEQQKNEALNREAILLRQQLKEAQEAFVKLSEQKGGPLKPSTDVSIQDLRHLTAACLPATLNFQGDPKDEKTFNHHKSEVVAMALEYARLIVAATT